MTRLDRDVDCIPDEDEREFVARVRYGQLLDRAELSSLARLFTELSILYPEGRLHLAAEEPCSSYGDDFAELYCEVQSPQTPEEIDAARQKQRNHELYEQSKKLFEPQDKGVQ